MIAIPFEKSVAEYGFSMYNIKLKCCTVCRKQSSNMNSRIA
jgi:hypothetical protein